MEILEINGKVVDLPNKPITRKIQIGNISQVGERLSSYSYSISLPRTTRNIEVFEWLGVIGNTSRAPYKKLTANYTIDDITIVKNGTVVISSVSGQNVTINLVDGVTGLSDILGNSMVKDLPFSDLDHLLTTDNYLNSYGNTEGYIYALGDFGQGRPSSSTTKVEQQAPSIYVHTIMSRIFSNAGLILVGDFFEKDQKYRSEVITPSLGYEITDDALKEVYNGSTTSLTASVSILTLAESIRLQVGFKDVNLDSFRIDAENRIVCKDFGRYRFEFTYYVTVYQTAVDIVVRVNGNSVYYTTTATSGTFPYSSILDLSTDDVITVEAVGRSTQIIDDPSLDPSLPPDTPEQGEVQKIINYSVNFTLEVEGVEGGQLIQPIAALGEITQVDFVKDVCNRHGLVLHPTKNFNEFKFERLEKVLSDRQNAIDWSTKLSSYNSESYSSGYAQQNTASYSYPEGTAVASLDGNLYVDNYNTTVTATLFTSPFEVPTEGRVMVFSGNQIPSYIIPIWAVEDGELENSETPEKVMSISYVNSSINVSLLSESSGTFFSGNIPILSLENMSLQQVIDERYRSLANLVNSYKEVDLLVDLSIVDIYNLDFFKLVYFQQMGRYYYLQSVEYTVGSLAKIKALEIAEFVENLPPYQLGDYVTELNAGRQKVVTLDDLVVGYLDPEGDAPYKIKIINGFNTDVTISRRGNDIRGETEFTAQEIADYPLIIYANDTLPAGHTEQWQFAIADSGSRSYGEHRAYIRTVVNDLVNDPPVAVAGSDLNLTYYPTVDNTWKINLNGSQSYDYTGKIIRWEWRLISHPENSKHELVPNDTTPYATLRIVNDLVNIGEFKLSLTVYDEYGASDVDYKSIFFNE